MKDFFLRIHIFLRNLYSGKIKTTNNDVSSNEDIVHNAPNSLATLTLTASNKIYEEDELLTTERTNDSDLDGEFGLRNEPCNCRACYIIKDILLIRSYKCANERKRDIFLDI